MTEFKLPMKALKNTVDVRENQISVVKTHYDLACLDMIQSYIYATISLSSHKDTYHIEQEHRQLSFIRYF